MWARQNVYVIANDGVADSTRQNATITIDGINDNAPTGVVISAASVAEGAGGGVVVGPFGGDGSTTVR